MEILLSPGQLSSERSNRKVRPSTNPPVIPSQASQAKALFKYNNTFSLSLISWNFFWMSSVDRAVLVSFKNPNYHQRYSSKYYLSLRIRPALSLLTSLRWRWSPNSRRQGWNTVRSWTRCTRIPAWSTARCVWRWRWSWGRSSRTWQRSRQQPSGICRRCCYCSIRSRGKCTPSS